MSGNKFTVEERIVRKQIYSRRENPGGTDMRRRKDECI